MAEQLVFFPGEAAYDVSSVGGKGASLLRMMERGLPVPPGAVLTTSFFEPCFEVIRSMPEWEAIERGPEDEWRSATRALRLRCAAIAWTEAQERTLADLRDHLRASGDDARFAVRSSSPDEDLSTASFAGGYETRLGVRLDDLEPAIRDCLASSLGARVLVYKKQHGFDPFAPSIAVVVQKQVCSEVAGVGFSINPITNDYDEAVIDANWGLGESVVSGAVTPDQYIVHRVSGEVISRTLGAKRVSIHVDPGGGTDTREDARADEWCLDDAQLGELTGAIERVEAMFGVPVDIEWAYADGQLHVLQARPITAYVPLPTEMITQPGERRRLYMDIALSGGLTINAPISPIGQSWMARFSSLLIDAFIGKLNLTLGKGDELWFLAGGRMYMDLSNILWLASPGRLANSQKKGDELMAATLANIDVDTYRSTKRPPWARLRMLRILPRIWWRARRMIWNVLRATLFPGRARRRFEREVRAFEREFADLPEELSIPELLQRYGSRVIHHVLGVTMPPLMMSLAGLSLLDAVVPRRHRDFLEQLQRGYDGNVVVEMGQALYRLSRLLEPADLSDPETLARRLRDGQLPEPFVRAWQAFLDSYGWRGPHEVDLGSARYRDDPHLALSQICMMASAGFDPVFAHAEQVQARERAYAALIARLGFFRRLIARRAYRWVEAFAGTRDTPKHDYLMFFAAVRRRAMHEGRLLCEAGRLDAPEQVLDLTIDDIEEASRDEALDLRARRAENTRFLDVLRRHVKGFPAVIDSRGRILRPAPRPETPGELSGMPICAGTVRGPAKVLLEPGEKPVVPGDILVAHTTDPGWTPLFINAAGIVLEVGGVLQHGAVVAREYGKPCVAGIVNLLSRIEDGQLLEVDGSTGVVRLLDGSDGQGTNHHA